MLTLKVLSALLGYPQAEMLEALNEMAQAVEQDIGLPSAEKSALAGLIESLRGADLMALQEDYVAQFDRGRALSLHLFEHVHGESRDRGQAMVNLMQLYRRQGFEIAARELPDYIPLFLEFLSHLPKELALPVLRDAMPVLSLLGARLAERGSSYRVVFDALAGLAGEPEALAEIRAQVAAEGPDETLDRMDEIWEEEAVSFMGNGDTCRNPASTESPVVIKPRHALESRSL